MVPSKVADGYRITTKATTGTVWVTFFGHTYLHDLQRCFDELERVLPKTDIRLVIDLRDLADHNPETREPWKQWLRAHKKRLERVEIIVQSSAAIIKMVAATVGLAVGVKLRLVDDPEEADR